MTSGADLAELFASLLAASETATRHRLTVEIPGRAVDVHTDTSEGVGIVRTLFGPFCRVVDLAPTAARPAERWRVASSLVSDLPDQLDRISGSSRVVRRWPNDLPADRYDLDDMRCFVVHREPFVGLTLFAGDRREIHYLRPTAAYDIPHTEHVVKYPLRVALRQDGYSQVHAATCDRDGKGLIIMGEKGSGKSTLLMHLVDRGARFMANDLSFARPGGDGDPGVTLLAFPSMTRLADGTIQDNPTLQAAFAPLLAPTDYLRSPVFNAGKQELYVPVLQQIWGPDVICGTTPLALVLFPSFAADRGEASATRLSPHEAGQRMRDTLVGDPPLPDWLPFMSDGAFAALTEQLAEALVRAAPPAYVLRYGPRHTDPVALVDKLLTEAG